MNKLDRGKVAPLCHKFSAAVHSASEALAP